MQIFDTIMTTDIICWMINIVSLSPVSNFVSGGFASLQLNGLKKTVYITNSDWCGKTRYDFLVLSSQFIVYVIKSSL